MKKPPSPVSIQAGKIEFVRTNSVKPGLRDLYRSILALKLEFDRLIIFPSAITIRHVIDETSPLHDVTPAQLEASNTRFMTSIVCIDTVIQAPVQSQTGYLWSDVRFGHRFVEIYTDQPDGRLMVDYGRLHETEPVPAQVKAS